VSGGGPVWTTGAAATVLAVALILLAFAPAAYADDEAEEAVAESYRQAGYQAVVVRVKVSPVQR